MASGYPGAPVVSPCEILANSLRKTFGEGVEFKLAAGGMGLWVRLRMSVDVDLWARRSVERGVSWYTGRRYAFDGQSKPFARFSFAWLNERELPEAVSAPRTSRCRRARISRSPAPSSPPRRGLP